MDDELFLKIIKIVSTHDEDEGQFCDTGEDMEWHCRSECTGQAIQRLRRAKIVGLI